MHNIILSFKVQGTKHGAHSKQFKMKCYSSSADVCWQSHSGQEFVLVAQSTTDRQIPWKTTQNSISIFNIRFFMNSGCFVTHDYNLSFLMERAIRPWVTIFGVKISSQLFSRFSIGAKTAHGFRKYCSSNFFSVHSMHISTSKSLVGKTNVLKKTNKKKKACSFNPMPSGHFHYAKP